MRRWLVISKTSTTAIVIAQSTRLLTLIHCTTLRIVIFIIFTVDHCCKRVASARKSVVRKVSEWSEQMLHFLWALQNVYKTVTDIHWSSYSELLIFLSERRESDGKWINTMNPCCCKNINYWLLFSKWEPQFCKKGRSCDVCGKELPIPLYPGVIMIFAQICLHNKSNGR